MTNQEIGELATIASRYKILKLAAQQTVKSLMNLKFELFTDFISDEEMTILVKAEKIANEISSNTNERDAIKYFESLHKEEIINS
jgi:hypothetical protein